MGTAGRRWLAVLVLTAAAVAKAEERGACTFGDPAPCAPFGCLPEAGATVERNRIETGARGYCGACSDDADCGGAKCDAGTGACATYAAPPIPRPLRPRFHLLTADLSWNLADASDPKPIVGIGYVYQVSFTRTNPVARTGGGWITADLPSWYASGGVSAAFAGPAQNLFADAGLTWYRPGLPLGVTTVTASALFQRSGSRIWDLTDGRGSTDRLGPALAVGFLQNLWLRAGYVFSLRGPVDHDALILSVVYMRDLTGDLVPDRYRKHLPAALR